MVDKTLVIQVGEIRVDEERDGKYTALKIIGPSKLAILRTLPLLYRFKPFLWRVQDH